MTETILPRKVRKERPSRAKPVTERPPRVTPKDNGLSYSDKMQLARDRRDHVTLARFSWDKPHNKP